MILNLGVSLYLYYFMVRVVLGDGSPSKITSYILKNNCTKFGTFVRFVSSKFTTKQLDYKVCAPISCFDENLLNLV